MDVSFSCVCPVIDNEFRLIDSYFDNVMTKFMINNRTDALKTDVNLLNPRFVKACIFGGDGRPYTGLQFKSE